MKVCRNDMRNNICAKKVKCANVRRSNRHGSICVSGFTGANHELCAYGTSWLYNHLTLSINAPIVKPDY